MSLTENGPIVSSPSWPATLLHELIRGLMFLPPCCCAISFGTFLVIMIKVDFIAGTYLQTMSKIFQ